MTDNSEFSLAELVIVAASEAWRGNGEIVASGIGPVPRLGASLAKLTFAPELMMTDSDAHFVEEPVPLGPRGDYKPNYSGYLPFSRFFDSTVWNGKRHAMVSPVQIDRWGQMNLSCLGDFHKPKVQFLGVRGYPGNSINHINSMFVPGHSSRVFVADEVDVVCSAGYNPKRQMPGERRDFVDIRLIVTNLCLMDFGGPDHAVRVTSLHPGVTFDEVQAATGFPLLRAEPLPVTLAPTAEQLAIIRRLDPHNIRATVIKDNPPGVRAA